MTNLTEYSWYYCKMNDGDIRMLERGADYFLDGDVPLLNNEVKSVLAEVPSYELWKAVHEQWEVLLEENKRLKHDVGNLGYKIKNQRHEIDNRLKEIEKIKELLKRCKRIIEIDESVSITGAGRDILWDLLQDLKQVLGENK